MKTMNITVYILLIISGLLFTCENSSKKEIETIANSIDENELIKGNSNRQLLERAINNYMMQDYFEEFKKTNKNLYIIKNEHFDDQKEMKLRWNGEIISDITFEEIDKKVEAHYIVFTKKVIEKDSAFVDFYFSYSFINSENIFSYKKDDGWILNSSRTYKN